MNEEHNYSDEYINAYIDGELDYDERKQLLFDEQSNAELAGRINDARILKEKVQLTYAGIKKPRYEKKPFRCAAFFNRHRALAASFLLLSSLVAMLVLNSGNDEHILIARQLIKNTPPTLTVNLNTAIGNERHIVLNIASYDAKSFSETVNVIDMVLSRRSNDGSFSMEIVANKQGLKALDVKSSAHAIQLKQLADRYHSLKIVACAKSLADLATAGDPVKLMESIIITPSAAQQVAKRTAAGWLYLKL